MREAGSMDASRAVVADQGFHGMAGALQQSLCHARLARVRRNTRFSANAEKGPRCRSDMSNPRRV
jgi:hypothetical protein